MSCATRPSTPRASAGSSSGLGHRLHAEMTLAVDPALSLADSSKLADEIKGHAHRRLAALESLHAEVVPASGRERPEHHPEAEHQHQH